MVLCGHFVSLCGCPGAGRRAPTPRIRKKNWEKFFAWHLSQAHRRGPCGRKPGRRDRIFSGPLTDLADGHVWAFCLTLTGRETETRGAQRGGSSKKIFASHIHGCRNYNDSDDSRTGRVCLAGPLSAVGSGRRGGGAKKKDLFSSAWLQKVRLKLQLVCSHRNRHTRPIESCCLIDKQLSSLDESRFLRGGRGERQNKRPLFSYTWLQKVRLKLQPVCSHRKRLTRPVESWCLIDKQLSSLDESLVAKGEPTEIRPFLPLAFVRVVAKSSFKIATCALAPKMCDTSRRF